MRRFLRVHFGSSDQPTPAPLPLPVREAGRNPNESQTNQKERARRQQSQPDQREKIIILHALIDSAGDESHGAQRYPQRTYTNRPNLGLSAVSNGGIL